MKREMKVMETRAEHSQITTIVHRRKMLDILRFTLEQVCLPFICHTRLIDAQDGHIPLVTKMKENSKMEI
jgi:hypothetical protein